MILTWSSVISRSPAQHLAGVRIDDVLEHDATEDAVAEALDDLAAFDQRHHLDALAGAAVELADDRVLRTSTSGGSGNPSSPS
jgi:hypothetical protein